MVTLQTLQKNGKKLTFRNVASRKMKFSLVLPFCCCFSVLIMLGTFLSFSFCVSYYVLCLKRRIFHYMYILSSFFSEYIRLYITRKQHLCRVSRLAMENTFLKFAQIFGKILQNFWIFLQILFICCNQKCSLEEYKRNQLMHLYSFSA